MSFRCYQDITVKSLRSNLTAGTSSPEARTGTLWCGAPRGSTLAVSTHYDIQSEYSHRLNRTRVSIYNFVWWRTVTVTLTFIIYRSVLCLEFQYLRVITGSADGRLRIWNMITGQCCRIMRGNSASDPIQSIIAIDDRYPLYRFFMKSCEYSISS